MADAVLTLVIENVNSLIQKEFGLILGLEDDMEKLSSTLSTVKDVLQDAQEKRIITGVAMKNWLDKLQKESEAANTVLSAWSAKDLKQDQSTNKGCTASTGNVFLSYLNIKRLIFRRSTAQKLKEFIARFDEIALERSKFHLIPGIEKKQSFDYNKETTSTLYEEVHGREEDKVKILDMVLISSTDEKVSVLPIVGAGGVGKTTLAKLIYNDEKVLSHFEVGIWVWVSKKFDIKRVINSIIESLNADRCDIKSFDAKQTRLKHLLGGKRYLLVLDDVWNEDKAKWNHLKSLLSKGAEGSAIIVTTPLQSAASIVSTFPDPHCLEPWKAGNNISTQKVRYQTMASWRIPEGNEEEHD